MSELLLRSSGQRAEDTPQKNRNLAGMQEVMPAIDQSDRPQLLKLTLILPEMLKYI